MITDMGAEGVEETLQTAVDPLIRNTVFKENNNLLLSGKDYLDSFLVGALSVGALHAKSTAIGLSTDVIGSLYKMKNSKGQHLPNETLKAYLTNNATKADIQKIDTWAKDVKAEDIDKMTDDMKNIASVKIGGIAYGDISKATSNMDSGKTIEFYHKIMNSPEYKAETELIKSYKAKGNDGNNNNIERISSNPANPKGNPNDYAGTEQASAYPDDNNGGKLGNAGTIVANETPDPKKPDNNIPMEKAANGYEYDAYENTDANSNNLNNKPLNMESRSGEGKGGGNDVEVYNKNTDSSNIDSKNYDVGNASSSQFENTAGIDNNDIANSDEIGYKEGEENIYSQGSEIPKDILNTKPQNSRIPKGWFDIGGKISVDKNNTWTYIGPQNQTVTYNNDYADFKGSGHVIQEINIGEFKSRPDDYRRANKLAPNGPKSPDSVWHHNEDGQTMQEINKIIHEMFTHKGGFSEMKKNK